MTDFDQAEFFRGVGAIIREAVEPLRKEIEELKARQPEKGEPGPPGDPGKDAEPVLVADIVAELVKSDLLTPVMDLYAAEAVAKHFEANPVQHGKDGAQGPEGKAGVDGKSVSLDEVTVILEAAVAKHVLDLERRATDAISKAIDKIPAPKDGKDGADFSEASIDYDGERTITIKGKGGEIVKHVPIPLDRGYWREGMAAQKADILTHDGNAWLAIRDTKAKPCAENKEDWRLFARKGRDGKDGRNGIDKTAPVKVNPDA